MTLLLILSFLLHIFVKPVLAQDMQSPNYQLQDGSFSFDSSTPSTSSSDTTTDNQPQLEDLTQQQQQQFETYGYTVLSSGENTQPTADFSATDLSFDDLSNNPVQTQDLHLTLGNQGSTEYVLYLSKETPFASPHKKIIPNTLCSESTFCTAQRAQKWDSDSVYGLGYQIEGKNKPIDFIDDNYYRTFNSSIKPEKISTYSSQLSSKTTTLRFKLAMPTDQTDSTYDTTLSLFFVPQP